MSKFLYVNYFLILLPIVLFLVLLYFNGGKKIHFSNVDDLKKIFYYNSFFYKIYFLLIFLVFFVFVSILAKPVEEKTLENFSKNGIDIQIVLDVSYSMVATDLKPNRLEVAKDVISRFIDKIETDRAGLIIYAGKTFTSLPLSFDYNIIKKTIKKIDISTIDQRYFHLQGTATGDALILAGKTFSQDKDREKVIILLTDGEANKGIDPLVAVDYLNEKYPGIKIYSIGIGGNKDTTITMNNQQLKISGVDEDSLKEISKKTNGKYFLATDRDSLENIFDTISKLEKKEIVFESIQINKEKYTFFIYILILFFFLLIILKERKNIL